MGDTHGDTAAVCNIAIPQALKHDCPVIVQCGDFGYWPHTQNGLRFLDKVSEHAVRADVQIFWVDGNHDNHPVLWREHQPGPDGFVPVRPNLSYIPRGHVWEWDDVRFCGMGGAFSIDKERRLLAEQERGAPGSLYWPTEMISPEDSRRMIERVKKQSVDVMFSHDAPEGTAIPGVALTGKLDFPETLRNRQALKAVFLAARPKLLVHGHYHIRYTDAVRFDGKYEYCRVEGLAMNRENGFVLVLDLDLLFSEKSSLT